ncbi:MAG: hypothetical protein QM733_13300 [Ilumatobacteraceae bacterium]
MAGTIVVVVATIAAAVVVGDVPGLDAVAPGEEPAPDDAGAAALAQAVRVAATIVAAQVNRVRPLRIVRP